MRIAATFVVATLACAACDREPAPVEPGGQVVAGSSSAAPSASPSAVKIERCLKLNIAIAEAARAAPRACKKAETCELAGPSACHVKGEIYSCMVAVAKGHAKPINDAADAWREAGCEDGLKEPPKKETPTCKAGTCFVER